MLRFFSQPLLQQRFVCASFRANLSLPSCGINVNRVPFAVASSNAVAGYASTSKRVMRKRKVATTASKKKRLSKKSTSSQQNLHQPLGDGISTDVVVKEEVAENFAAQENDAESKDSETGEALLVDKYEDLKRSSLSMYRKLLRESYRFVEFAEQNGVPSKVLKLVPVYDIYNSVRRYAKKQYIINDRQLERKWKFYAERLQSVPDEELDSEENKRLFSVLEADLDTHIALLNHELREYQYYALCGIGRAYRECLLWNKRNKRKNFDLSVRMHLLRLFSSSQIGNDMYKKQLVDVMVQMEQMERERKAWRTFRRQSQSSRRSEKQEITNHLEAGDEDENAYENDEEEDLEQEEISDTPAKGNKQAVKSKGASAAKAKAKRRTKAK